MNAKGEIELNLREGSCLPWVGYLTHSSTLTCCPSPAHFFICLHHPESPLGLGPSVVSRSPLVAPQTDLLSWDFLWISDGVSI